jgi:hypothetical protein
MMADIEPAGGIPAPGALARAGRYLTDRLAEPGTMRSVVWVFMGLMGLDQGETSLTYVAGVATVVLGLLSALRPEPVRAVAVPEITMDTGTAIQVLARAAVAAEAREASRS